MAEPAWLRIPDWPLPEGVHAFLTTRGAGPGEDPYGAFNLAQHVGDDAARVQKRREQLLAELQARGQCPALEIQWLEQVHGTEVVEALHPVSNNPPPRADALFTRAAGLACAVMTADCLPVLFCSDDGAEVAVAHAGWRGLLGGVLEQTVAHFSVPPARIHAWLGPAIASCHFEVGPEVREAFLDAATLATRDATAAAFRPAPAQPDGITRSYLDLYQLARLRLAGLGSITGDPDCTVCHQDRWYSYRASPRTGRFATLIFKSRA